MREIKFREWDPVREEMYADSDNSVHFGMSYSTRIEYDNSTGFVFRHEEDIDHEFRDKKIVDVHGEPTRKLMQYTGLKDKNGKPIYEGDIVRYTAWHDGKPAGAIQGGVVYDGDLGMASFNILLDRNGEIDRAVLPAIGVEVLGNIYENPELLEGE